MKNNKKTIIIVVATVVVVALIATGAIFALKNVNNDKDNNDTPVVTTESADALKNRGIEVLKTDKQEAKEIFEEAKTQYEELGDTDKTVDMEAQLWMIDHPVEAE